VTVLPRYPIFIPTRDRWQKDRRWTIKALLRDGVPFRAVVVPSQVKDYEPIVGKDRLLVLPNDKMILRDSRNWIRTFAEAEGHARHWQLDDNIKEFRRLYYGRRIPCHAGIALRVCEDLTDRYSNVGLSGLNYQMFVPAETPVPFYLNVHVYSCTLVNHAMPYRWRLIYNDDTDICLQALTQGWCTILVNAFMADKLRTMRVQGGNTNALYTSEEEGDSRNTQGRFEMARVLERAWPGIVSVRWRFQRAQHVINWRSFTTPLRLREDFDAAALPPVDEYGMTLRQAKPEIKSPAIRELLVRYHEENGLSAGPEEPAGVAENDRTEAVGGPVIVFTDHTRANERLYAHADCPGQSGRAIVWTVDLDADDLQQYAQCRGCGRTLPVEPFRAETETEAVT
jgi:hypothetical protein